MFHVHLAATNELKVMEHCLEHAAAMESPMRQCDIFLICPVSDQLGVTSLTRWNVLQSKDGGKKGKFRLEIATR